MGCQADPTDCRWGCQADPTNRLWGAKLTPVTVTGVPISITHPERILAQRGRWVALGLALIEGKRITPHDLAFGKWVKENGFDNRCRATRAAAMKVAALTRLSLKQVPVGITNPQMVLAHIAGIDIERSDDASADPVLKEMPAPKFFTKSMSG